ncbi:MAG: T9SS type A sorting domain-containing protein [bacterium]|nr:T9SS type A sorting domain-containing protein [bacterium]
MKNTGIILLTVFSIAICAHAQLTITSSTPANFATGVALTTTVSFTFSAALDTTIRYESGYPVGISGPEDDSLIVTGASISGDLRTVSIQVMQRPTTDYVWMVTGARSQSGQDLQIPYMLNYTTSTSYGVRTVSGTVTYPLGNANRAVAGLLNRRIFEDNGRLLIGTNVSTANSYSISNVRSGVFWPVCAIDLNSDGEIDPDLGDAIGFYDPNQDGIPDSIVVGQSNLTNINMTLIVWQPLRARDRLPVVQSLARQFAADAVLKVISTSGETNPNGTCDSWIYMFHSPQRQRNFIVFASSQMTAIDTVESPEFPLEMITIPVNCIDSDSAMAIAERNGGATFRMNNPNASIEMLAGNFFWMMPTDPTRIVWMISYDSPEQDESLTIILDIVTGQVIPVTATPEPIVAKPTTYRILSNYPNPFNAETTIRYQVPATGKVTLEIYNSMGQRIRSLVSAVKPAGKYEAKFNGNGLSSGVYVVRMSTGKSVYQSKMMLIK